MSQICNRFRKIRESKNMTITAVAAAIDEKRQRLQDIEAGKQKIPEDIIVKYIEYFDINANWLLTGEGEMLKIKSVEPQTLGLDSKRLTLAIETVEEGLHSTRRTMDPDKKAELIMAVYDLFKDQTPDVKQSLLRLVQSVAA
ncbi:MAG: XRE family transcriptional regulator [Methylobacter sp.]|nr:MAG: XRE family transcriptional regulator [Methylobacter sp.]